MLKTRYVGWLGKDVGTGLSKVLDETGFAILRVIEKLLNL